MKRAGIVNVSLFLIYNVYCLFYMVFVLACILMQCKKTVVAVQRRCAIKKMISITLLLYPGLGLARSECKQWQSSFLKHISGISQKCWLHGCPTDLSKHNFS